MPRGRAWRVAEERFIRRCAGELSIEEMAEALGRTPSAVEWHARQMRRRKALKGSLRHWRRRLSWCGECAAYRSDPCPVCSKRALLESKRLREEALLAQLPAERKSMKRPGLHGSARDRMPAKPNTDGMHAYARQATLEAYDKEMERWECRNLDREIKAVQKRCERLVKEINEIIHGFTGSSGGTHEK